MAVMQTVGNGLQRERYSNLCTLAVAFRLSPTADAFARDLSAESAARLAKAETAVREIKLLQKPDSNWLIDWGILRVRFSVLLFIDIQERLGADFEHLISQILRPAEIALLRDDFYALQNTDSLLVRGSGKAEMNLGFRFLNESDWRQGMQARLATSRIYGRIAVAGGRG